MYRISSKNLAWNCLRFAEFLEVNIQHSICVHILFPFIHIHMTTFAENLETILVKDAEQLEGPNF